jgi:hypothetical protein
MGGAGTSKALIVFFSMIFVSIGNCLEKEKAVKDDIGKEVLLARVRMGYGK